MQRFCAEGASFSTALGFQTASVCLSVRPSQILVIFANGDMRRLHPHFPLVIFQLGFSGIPENHEKKSKSPCREHSRRTPLWAPFFLAFFLKKFRFSLQGLVMVRSLVLARTRGDFAQPCPAGQSSQALQILFKSPTPLSRLIRERSNRSYQILDFSNYFSTA